ncbi:hypothetical protein, partial [Streptomyces misionensis]
GQRGQPDRRHGGAGARAEIPAQASGEPETKPRRTRKTAAATEAATDEAAPAAKPRRTRKATAAVEAPEA